MHYSGENKVIGENTKGKHKYYNEDKNFPLYNH